MSFTMKKIGVISSAIFAIAVLPGCGGGGSGDESLNSETDSPNQGDIILEPGAYALSPSEGPINDTNTLLSPSGEIVTLFAADDITVGDIEYGMGGSISGSATDYSFDGSSWQTLTGDISGEILSSSAATFTASAAGFGSINYVLARDDQWSDRGVTITELSGTYLMDRPDVLVTSVTISGDGTLTGNDETGCVFNGNVEIPDPQYNVYEVTYQADNCSDSQRNGIYSGLGTYEPSLSQTRFVGSSAEVGSFFLGTK